MDDSDDYDEDTSKISLAREQPPPPPPPRRMTRSCALSLIALSAVGFALQSLLVKLLTSGALGGAVASMEAVLFRGCGQLFGCCCVLSCSPAQRRSPRRWLGDSWRQCRWLTARGVVGFAGVCFMFKSVSMLGLAEAQVVGSLAPCFAAVYACLLLGEPWLRLERCAALVAVVGVAVQFGDWRTVTDASERVHVLGLVCALAGTASAAGAHVLVRVLGTTVKVDWPIPMTYQALAQIAFSGLALRAYGEQWRFQFSKWDAAALGGCAFIGFLSQICMTMGMQNEKSASASVMRMTGLPVSFALQALVTREPIKARTLLGTALIVSSLALVIYSSRTKSMSKNAPHPSTTRGARSKKKKPSFFVSLPALATNSYERHVYEPLDIEMPKRAATADADQPPAGV